MALCAGVGGLELGLRLSVSRYRTVCYVERETYAAAVLVARMEAGELDEAPIWDDVETFDGRRWRGYVHIISAGFPCQPWSAAGSQKGTKDERWVWPEIARIIREVEPRYVFLENVPNLAIGGLGVVLGDLALCGFDAEWDLFSAESEGAPHVRKRIFILAMADSNGTRQPSRGPRGEIGRAPEQPEPSMGREPGEWWEVEPRLGRVVDGAPNWVDRIRSIGNGVVPAVAARAFTELSERFR